jgi:hypothetical protein
VAGSLSSCKQAAAATDGGADAPLLLLQVITPWDVSGGADGKVDYDKLIREVSREWWELDQPRHRQAPMPFMAAGKCIAA